MVVFNPNYDARYFQGSADSVKLSTYNTDESKALSTIDDCVGKLKLIIDSCDGNDPFNNPHNYKFGGADTSPEGWEFKVEPTARGQLRRLVQAYIR